MLRIAIVEDEDAAAAIISDDLTRFEETADERFHVECFREPVSFLEPYRGFDLVFMDIQLPMLDGMEAAQRLRRVDTQVILIFVTNMAQYAVRGYEVDALDFIVKPVIYPDFVFRMQRALRALRLRRGKALMIPQPSGMLRLNTDELFYVEVRGHTLAYHLAEKTVEVRGTMDSAERQLVSFHFLRCNNCYLVNPRYIEWVRDYIVKVGDDELQISHPRRKTFMEGLSRWYAQGGI